MKFDPSKHIWTSFFVLSLIILFFWGSYSLQSTFYDSLPAIKNFIQQAPILYGLVFFLLAAFSAMLSPFSSVPLVPFAVLSWGKLITTILLLSGWLLGGIITFSLARYLARPALQRFVSFKKLDHYIKLIPKKFEFPLLLLFRISTPVEIPGYALGLTKVSFFKYILATAIAEIPFAIFSIYGSEAFLEKKFFLVILWITATVLLLLTAFYLFYRRVKRH